MSGLAHRRFLPMRVVRLLAVLTAVALLASVLTVIPWMLLTVVRFSPVPHGLPDWDQLRFRYAADPAALLRPLLCAVAWACWTVLTLRVLATAAWYAAHPCRLWRRHRLPSRPALSRGGWVRLLFGGILVGWLTAARAAAAAPLPAHSATTSTSPLWPATTTAPETGSSTLPVTYTVRPGDTLWGIAQRLLGEGDRCTELFHLNQGHPQPDGGTLTDPDLIQPGWVLRLPEAAPWTPRTSTSQVPQSAPRPSALTPHAEPGADPGTTARPNAHAATDRPTAAPRAHQPGRGRAGIDLGEAGFVGVTLAAGIVVALAYARTIHRVRRRTGSGPASGRSRTVSRLHRAHLDGLAADQLQQQRSADNAHDQSSVPSDEDARPRPLPVGVLALGEQEQTETPWQPTPGQPLVLSGPGAPDAARALLLAQLADAERARPQHTAVPRAVIPAGTARLLLPGIDTERLPPTLLITPTLAAALEAIESAELTRQRLADRDEPTSEKLPAPLLIADAASEWEPEQALTVSGSAVLLHEGATGVGGYRVEADGTAQPATAEPSQGLRLFHLPAPTAEDLLHLLADAYAHGHPSQPADRRKLPAHAEPEADPDDHPLVRMRLLGGYEVTANGVPVTTGWRRSARELLAYLAVHPDGATREEITCALWPDEPPRPGNGPFHTALANVRARLREATGTGLDTDFVLHVDGRYCLDPRLVETDVARIRTALRRAARARKSTLHGEEQEALREVAQYACGELLPGLAYEWQNSAWVSLQRDIIDGLQRAAEIEKDASHKIGYLEKALACDPYDEELYEHLACLQEASAHPGAAARTRALGRTRLSELGPER